MPRPLDVPHQAILQLRNPTKEIIRFTDAELEKNVRTKVNEVVNVENGLDYYLTDKDEAVKIARRLRTKFGGEFIVSPKLYTFDSQHGKRIYRLAVLFRYYPVKKGDIVEIKGKKIKIIFLGKKIFGQEEKTGKKVHLEFEDLK